MKRKSLYCLFLVPIGMVALFAIMIWFSMREVADDEDAPNVVTGELFMTTGLHSQI